MSTRSSTDSWLGSKIDEGATHEPAELYAGPARLDDVEVHVHLRGHFEPHGSAEGRLSDVDPWGRFRIAGTGRPPF